MDADFWLDVLKTLIGTAIGAGLAFGSNYFIQHLQRRRDRYAALATAMEVLRTQLDDFRNYRTGFSAELAEQLAKQKHPVPEWAIARPLAFYFFDSLKFNYPSLAFVLEYEGQQTLAKLRYAERRYHELATLAREYNVAVQRKQERLAQEFGVGAANLGEVERRLGPEIFGRIESMIQAIRRHVDLDEKDYLAAEVALSGTTTKAFPRKPRLALDRVPTNGLKVASP